MNDERVVEARTLRQQGKTYKQIAEETGLSVDWCKKNLKTVPKGEVEDTCLDELIRLATRPEGVSVYEANGVIMKNNTGKNLSKDQLRYIRTKAKVKDPNSLFRPDWVSTQTPIESFKAFTAYVMHMQDEIDNLVRWYCDSFPDTNPYSVKWELLAYLRPDKDGISLSRRISNAEVITEVMEARLEK